MKPCWDQAKEVEVMTVTQSNHSLTNLIMWQSPHGEYVRLTLRACSSATAFSSIQSTTPPLLHISASLNSLYVYFCEIYCYLPGTGVHQWRKLWSHDLSWTSSSGAPHYQWFSLSRSQNLSGRMTCWQSAGGHQRGASGKACRRRGRPWHQRQEQCCWSFSSWSASLGMKSQSHRNTTHACPCASPPVPFFSIGVIKHFETANQSEKRYSCKTKYILFLSPLAQYRVRARC